VNDLEIKILIFLWQKGPSLAKDIFEGISKTNLAYSTLSFYLRTLEHKGMIGHLKIGKIYTYHARLECDTFVDQQMHRILNSLFDGNRKKLSGFLKSNGWVIDWHCKL
jgi:predicted transcriptional regulator